MVDLLAVPLIQSMVGLFCIQTTTSESDREVLHMNDVKVIHIWISTNPQKVLHATTVDKVLQGQATIKMVQLQRPTL